MRRILFAAVMTVGFFVLPFAVNSQPAEREQVIQNIFVTCQGKSQVCNPPYSVKIETGSVLKVRYIVPPSHCSSVKIHFILDGKNVHSTGWLSWPGAPAPFSSYLLDTGIINLGHMSPGVHALSVQAEGLYGGCNKGYLASWAGTLRIITTPKK